MPNKRKYLTEERFEQFLNHFSHLERAVAYMKGQLSVVLVLLGGLLALIGYLIYLVLG